MSQITFRVLVNPLIFVELIAKWFRLSYSRPPWGDNKFVCSKCCPVDQLQNTFLEKYRYDTASVCHQHKCLRELIWSDERVSAYITHCLSVSDNLFVGVFVDGRFSGIVWGSPVVIKDTSGFYLDFICIDPDLRRVKGLSSSLVGITSLFLFRLPSWSPLFIQKLLLRVLYSVDAYSALLIWYWDREIKKKGYDLQFSRIINSPRIRWISKLVGFSEFFHQGVLLKDSFDPRRVIFIKKIY